MKKRILYLIITVMSISLLGIIGVQVYWIYNSVKVKQVQFNQLVNDALNNVIRDIGGNELDNFISSELSQIGPEALKSTDTFQKGEKQIKKWVKEITGYDSLNKEIRTIDYSISSSEQNFNVGTNSRVYYVDSPSKKITNDSLKNKIRDEVALEKMFGEVIVKLNEKFTKIENPIAHRLKNINIKTIVQLHLKDNGITAPFSHGILKDSTVIDQFSSKNYLHSEESYSVNLFKNQRNNLAAILAINFNEKQNYILKEMWLMVSCSILFTLIILLTFMITIHYMLKQKKLSEMKNDFINNMTHEFKTPIATISLAADAITHRKIIDKQDQINHFANIIKKENIRLNEQVENVLNISIREKKEIDFNNFKLNINEIILKSQARMHLQLEANNAKLDLKLSSDQPSILGDKLHLQNALCNLIDNAIKYNNKDPKITIETKSVNAFCEIKISDNGIGMSNETQKKVFDKFYRAQKGNIHTTKGFGIGLNYVKAIIDGHNGLITIKSKLHQGTIILIKLPNHEKTA